MSQFPCPVLQMRFMQELIATFKSPPAFLKMSKKRGTFFARKPASSAPSEPDVVKLLRGLELGIQATPIGQPRTCCAMAVCWTTCCNSAVLPWCRARAMYPSKMAGLATASGQAPSF
jgi:hypothetical protein